jgi:hypothetical protein
LKIFFKYLEEGKTIVPARLKVIIASIRFLETSKIIDVLLKAFFKHGAISDKLQGKNFVSMYLVSLLLLNYFA